MWAWTHLSRENTRALETRLTGMRFSYAQFRQDRAPRQNVPEVQPPALPQRTQRNAGSGPHFFAAFFVLVAFFLMRFLLFAVALTLFACGVARCARWNGVVW